MNPEQKAARAYLKRKTSMGMGGTGLTAGLWKKPPKPPYTFEDAVRARRMRERLQESLARSKEKGTA